MENDAIIKCPRCNGKGYDEYYNWGRYFSKSAGQYGYCQCEKGLEWACHIKKYDNIIERCERVTGPTNYACFVCNGSGHRTWLDNVFNNYNPKRVFFQKSTDGDL